MNPLNVGVTGTSLSIDGLTRTDGGVDDPVTGNIPVSWTTTYTGTDTITEVVSYIHDDDPPVKFDVKTLTLSDLGAPQTSMLSTEKLPSGGYVIQVSAFTKDASDTKECGPYSFTTQGRSFIKLE
jgi:hypothetical protein